MLLLMVINMETGVVLNGNLPGAGVAALVLSCFGGLGMSYFSFALRAVISATSFSVIGNICKVLTILVNIVMWDQHASRSPSHRFYQRYDDRRKKCLAIRCRDPNIGTNLNPQLPSLMPLLFTLATLCTDAVGGIEEANSSGYLSRP
jgi:hypothetical protein